MKAAGSRVTRIVAAAVLMLSSPGVAVGQLISLKTIPIAAGDQFQLFPSQNQAMGGIDIAIDDSLLDPFINPAKGSLLNGALVFTSPTLYDVDGEFGSARSVPLGALVGSSSWYGGFALALQQLKPMNPTFGLPVFGPTWSQPTELSSSANNLYAFGMVGRSLDGKRASIGASVFYADLEALEGVDLLYAGSQRIEQSGHLLGVRLGLFGELSAGQDYEVLLLYNGLDMTHDVTYPEPVFEPTPGGPFERLRVEENEDKTNTWGVHLGYTHPLAGEGWRIGAILTGNYKTHPKIPNYDIMNIPRDPGDTWGFNLGLGVSRSLGPTVFGADLILEPIWSETWAEAAQPVTTRSGKIIPEGERTVDNDFQFMNTLLRLGVGVTHKRANFQLGLQVKSYDYTLEQTNLVEEQFRQQDESWFEWTPTFGVGLAFSEFEVRYAGRVTTGTGRPGVSWWSVAEPMAFDAAAGGDYIVAPSGPLTLQDANVWAHQLSLIIPLGT
jgi:hypothetical protein